MADSTTAGAEVKTPAPASLVLRDATFGDWIEIGDISRSTVVNPRGAGGDRAVEIKVNAYAVAQYFEALSGERPDVIRKLPYAASRLAYRELLAKVPAFDEATIFENPAVSALPDGGFEIRLRKPLAGAREQTKSVVLRPANSGDWIDCGDLHVQRALNPGDDNVPIGLEIKLDEDSVGRWMTKLTGLPWPILSLMDYHDARLVFAAIKTMLGGVDLGNS